jgi:hypothetical protein
MTTNFWAIDPTILFHKDYVFDLWPLPAMNYAQKMNAISRLIILLSILGFLLTGSINIIIIGMLTLFVIYSLYQRKSIQNSTADRINKDLLNEGFTNNTMVTGGSYVNPTSLETILKNEFEMSNKKNPFSNVLLTEINDTPNRKAAPPSFNVEVDEDITTNVKRAVQMINPSIKNTSKQLYGDVYQQFDLDQSNRQFYSTANTRVEPGDQAALGKFLYGDMPSSKESNAEGNMQRLKDNYRYILY